MGVPKKLPQEAAQWLRVQNEAASEISNREAALTAAAKQVEHSMEVLGVTAIEDRLQDEVADTIASLRAAKIKARFFFLQ